MKRARIITMVGFLLLGSARLGGAAVGYGVIEESEESKHARWKEKAKTDYKDGVQALAEGDMSRAVRLLLRVVEMSRMRIDSPYPERAFNELKKVTERAAEELAVARELLAGEDLAAGLTELKRIMRTYSGLWPAKQAGRQLRQLQNDPKVRQELRVVRLAADLKKALALEAEAEALARKPETPADAADPSPDPPAAKPQGLKVVVSERVMTEAERRAARLERLVQAYEIYARVAEKGSDTGPGKRAAEAIARLKKAPDLMDRIRRRQAERKANEWLGLARNYFKAGRFDLAREHCFRIVSAYPDLSQAAEAKALLASMK